MFFEKGLTNHLLIFQIVDIEVTTDDENILSIGATNKPKMSLRGRTLNSDNLNKINIFLLSQTTIT